MVADGPLTVGPPTAAATTGLDLSTLTAGRIVEARVTALAGQMAILASRQGPLEVDLGATTAVVGDLLRFEVRSIEGGDGRPRLQLELLPAKAETAAAAATTAQVDPTRQALGRAVVKAAAAQSGLSPLYATLAGLASAPAGSVPDPVRVLIGRLMEGRLAATEAPNAASVATAFRNSGLFLEARGGAGAAPTTQSDLKGLIGRLRTALEAWVGKPATPVETTARGGAGAPGEITPRVTSADGLAVRAAYGGATRTAAPPNAEPASVEGQARRAAAVYGGATGATGAARPTAMPIATSSSPSPSPSPSTATDAATPPGAMARGGETLQPPRGDGTPPSAPGPARGGAPVEAGSGRAAPVSMPEPSASATTTGRVRPAEAAPSPSAGSAPSVAAPAGSPAQAIGEAASPPPPIATTVAPSTPLAAPSTSPATLTSPPTTPTSPPTTSTLTTVPTLPTASDATVTSAAVSATPPGGATVSRAAVDAAALPGTPNGGGVPSTAGGGGGATLPPTAGAEAGRSSATTVVPDTPAAPTTNGPVGGPDRSASPRVSAAGPGSAGASAPEGPIAPRPPIGGSPPAGVPAAPTIGAATATVPVAAGGAGVRPEGGAPSGGGAGIAPSVAAAPAVAAAGVVPPRGDGVGGMVREVADAALLGGMPDTEAATTATAAIAGGVRERIARPPPPRKGQIPIAQGVSARENATSPEAAEMLGRRALERAEGALQRILLEQWAVLEDHGDGASPIAGRAGREWTAELPLATPSGTSIVQMTVERDGAGGTKGEAGAGVGWRVRFALDVEPIGPVHAQIGLAGEHLSVGLWVERPDMAARLANEVGDLTAALADDRVTVEAVHVAAGEPPQPKGEGGGGHFIDVSL